MYRGLISAFRKLMLMFPTACIFIHAVTFGHVIALWSPYGITLHIPTPWQPELGDPSMISDWSFFWLFAPRSNFDGGCSADLIFESIFLHCPNNYCFVQLIRHTTGKAKADTAGVYRVIRPRYQWWSPDYCNGLWKWKGEVRFLRNRGLLKLSWELRWLLKRMITKSKVRLTAG